MESSESSNQVQQQQEAIAAGEDVSDIRVRNSIIKSMKIKKAQKKKIIKLKNSASIPETEINFGFGPRDETPAKLDQSPYNHTIDVSEV